MVVTYVHLHVALFDTIGLDLVDLGFHSSSHAKSLSLLTMEFFVGFHGTV